MSISIVDSDLSIPNLIFSTSLQNEMIIDFQTPFFTNEIESKKYSFKLICDVDEKLPLLKLKENSCDCKNIVENNSDLKILYNTCNQNCKIIINLDKLDCKEALFKTNSKLTSKNAKDYIFVTSLNIDEFVGSFRIPISKLNRIKWVALQDIIVKENKNFRYTLYTSFKMIYGLII